MCRIGRNRGIMLLERLFKPRPARDAGRALYASAVSQARQPTLYTDLGAPDTAEGRFEIYSLHVILLLDRLRNQGELAGEVSQSLFDTYVKSLDHALRELGVGDLSVGRKMRKLGEAFYGRCKSYDAAFAALPDPETLNALVTRTVYAGLDSPPTAQLVAYIAHQRSALAAISTGDLVSGQVAWGEP